MKYQFRGPAAYNTDKTVSYPLVIYLHQSGYDPSSATAGQCWAPAYLQAVTANGAAFPGFLLVPLCPAPYEPSASVPAASGGEWNSPAARNLTVAAIRDLAARFNIDRKRIYVVGWSMGGAGTYYLADAFHSLTGSRVAAVSRGSGYSPDIALSAIHNNLSLSPVWIHVGNLEGSPYTTCVAAYNYLKTIHQAQGSTESVTTRSAGLGLVANPSPSNLQTEFRELLKAGVSHTRLSIYANTNHVDVMNNNADLLSWLFAQSIPANEAFN